MAKQSNPAGSVSHFRWHALLKSPITFIDASDNTGYATTVPCHLTSCSSVFEALYQYTQNRGYFDTPDPSLRITFRKSEELHFINDAPFTSADNPFINIPYLLLPLLQRFIPLMTFVSIEQVLELMQYVNTLDGMVDLISILANNRSLQQRLSHWYNELSQDDNTHQNQVKRLVAYTILTYDHYTPEKVDPNIVHICEIIATLIANKKRLCDKLTTKQQEHINTVCSVLLKQINAATMNLIASRIIKELILDIICVNDRDQNRQNVGEIYQKNMLISSSKSLKNIVTFLMRNKNTHIDFFLNALNLIHTSPNTAPTTAGFPVIGRQIAIAPSKHALLSYMIRTLFLDNPSDEELLSRVTLIWQNANSIAEEDCRISILSAPAYPQPSSSTPPSEPTASTVVDGTKIALWPEQGRLLDVPLIPTHENNAIAVDVLTQKTQSIVNYLQTDHDPISLDTILIQLLYPLLDLIKLDVQNENTTQFRKLVGDSIAELSENDRTRLLSRLKKLDDVISDAKFTFGRVLVCILRSFIYIVNRQLGPEESRLSTFAKDIGLTSAGFVRTFLKVQKVEAAEDLILCAAALFFGRKQSLRTELEDVRNDGDLSGIYRESGLSALHMSLTAPHAGGLHANTPASSSSSNGSVTTANTSRSTTADTVELIQATPFQATSFTP